MTTEVTKLDPWNWPMPGRESLMSLGKIEAGRDMVRAKTAVGMRPTRTTSNNMYTGDIEGSKPKVYAPATVNKPDTFNSNHDIEGSRPRILHVGLTRPFSSLYNEDIQGAKPDCIKFKTKRPPQNPLNPEYKLQSFTVVPPEPLRFVRDAMAIDDIEGCRTKIVRELATRDNYKVDDIPGAKAKKPLQRREGHQHDQTFADVYAKKKIERLHDPQNPSYMLRDEDGNLIEYGPVEGSSPKKPYVRKAQPGFGPLDSSDIQGNKPGSKTLGNFHSRERRDVVAVGRNDDIIGSQPGSLVKGIKRPEGVDRKFNPLDPEYQLPGAKETPVDLVNDKYGAKGSSMSKLNFEKIQKQKQEAAKPSQENVSQKPPASAKSSIRKPPMSAAGSRPAASGGAVSAKGSVRSFGAGSAKRPPSSQGKKSSLAASGARRMSSAQKLDSFIQK